MKNTTGLMVVLALCLGVYVGIEHGDKVLDALKGVKSEFRIAYVDEVLGKLDDSTEEQTDAGPTEEVREGE